MLRAFVTVQSVVDTIPERKEQKRLEQQSSTAIQFFMRQAVVTGFQRRLAAKRQYFFQAIMMFRIYRKRQVRVPIERCYYTLGAASHWTMFLLDEQAVKQIVTFLGQTREYGRIKYAIQRYVRAGATW